MKSVMTGVYFRDDESFTFNYNTNLTALEKATFVALVVDYLVRDNYHSILRDIVFDYHIITEFTDVDTTDIEDSIDKIEEFIEETNIVDIIKANVNAGLIDELSKAVDLDIEYRTGIHKNALGEALSGLIDVFKNKVAEVDVVELMEMAKAIGGITNELTPENIVKAYAKTDIFKKNVAELDKAKERRENFANEMIAVIDSKK